MFNFILYYFVLFYLMYKTLSVYIPSKKRRFMLIKPLISTPSFFYIFEEMSIELLREDLKTSLR